MIKTSEDELEASVGGSFLDDLLGAINYPDDTEWFESSTHVECRADGIIWRRSKEFLHGQGEYVEEWYKIFTD